MKLSYKDGWLEYYFQGDTIFVLSLFVEDRRKGTATKLMEMLHEKADELDADTIVFQAMSFDTEEGMQTDELKDWYERLGFQCVGEYTIGINKGYVMKMEF